jgi:hypothetical protein
VGWEVEAAIADSERFLEGSTPSPLDFVQECDSVGLSASLLFAARIVDTFAGWGVATFETLFEMGSAVETGTGSERSEFDERMTGGSQGPRLMVQRVGVHGRFPR